MAVWAPMQKGRGAGPGFSTVKVVEKPFSRSWCRTWRTKGKGKRARVSGLSRSSRTA